MKHICTLLLGLLMVMSSAVQAKIQAVWSTDAALPGEKVVLILLQEHLNTSNPSRFRFSTPGKVKNGRLYQGRNGNDNYFEESVQNAAGNTSGRIEGYLYVIEVGGSGLVECDDFEVTLSTGQKEIVSIPPLKVYTTAKVEWRNIETQKGENPSSFGTMWLVEPDEYYAGQPVHATLKLLLPQNFNRLEQDPQFYSQGITAGSFRSPLGGSVPGMVLQHAYPLRDRIVQARGQSWIVMDLEVDLIPQSSDKPAEGMYDAFVKLPALFLTSETITQTGAGFSFSSVTTKPTLKTLELPKLSLSAPRPLPPNPPADFSDLVGDFSISTSTDAKDLAMNEMVEVHITVKGTGCLEQLLCPQPQDAENWKLMPPTRQMINSPIGEPEAVVFSQLMRPSAEVSGIPSFSFSYFNASDEEYKTAASAPIGLPWRSTDAVGSGQVATASAAPPAGKVPVAEMTDIYHFLPNASEGGNGEGIRLAKEWWYLLYAPGALILLWLAGCALGKKWQAGAAKRGKDKLLAEVSAEKDNAAFLKKIGAFIESHLAGAQDPAVQAILNKRDAEVFRPDAQPYLSTEERNDMLKTVRKALSRVASLLLLLTLGLAYQANAEDAAMKAYSAGQYSKALELLQQEEKDGHADRDSGERLYNIGNCYYRLEEPGKAALYYARALQNTPNLAEAKANLGFIQRKEGAVLPNKKLADKIFTYLTAPQVWAAGIICSSLLLLSIALRLLLRERHKTGVRTAMGITATLSLLCVADYIYYATRTVPDITATPPADIAYITQATTARSAAIDTAGEVLELPPSTPVRILATRGQHRYVETFTGVRGWIPAEAATPLEPAGKTKNPFTITFE